jgi:hypothetical protein
MTGRTTIGAVADKYCRNDGAPATERARRRKSRVFSKAEERAIAESVAVVRVALRKLRPAQGRELAQGSFELIANTLAEELGLGAF